MPLPKPRGFGVGSSQHPYKAKAKLELKPCFGTAHVPPPCSSIASGRANLQEGCGGGGGVALLG